MRKLAALTLAIGALAITGCGEGAEEAASPLDEALGYLPADAPFVAVVDTDREGRQFKSVERMLERLPAGNTIERQIRKTLGGRAGDLDRIEAALGNEFVVGSANAKGFLEMGAAESDGDPGAQPERDSGEGSGADVAAAEGDGFVGAIEVTDRAALDGLLEREKARADGDRAGADLYRDSTGDSFAIKDGVLIFAGSKPELEEALDTRESESRMTEEMFERSLDGLPPNALVRVRADTAKLLRASPQAKDALGVKWVRALRTLGLALSFEDERVSIDFRVRTDPAGLTEADLPFASGSVSPPAFDRTGEVGIALRNPGHLLAFAEATAGIVNPEEFGGFGNAKATVERRLGLSLDEDVLGQLEGDVALRIMRGGKFGARAELEDPAGFERTLETLAEVLPDMARGITGKPVGFVKPKAGEEFYALATAEGETFAFGVVGDAFVLANDADLAGSLASEPTKPVPGARGSLVVNADAAQFVRGVFGQARERFESQLDVGDQLEDQLDLGKWLGDPKAVAGLDELIGSAEMSTRGLSGSFELTVEP